MAAVAAGIYGMTDDPFGIGKNQRHYAERFHHHHSSDKEKQGENL